MTGPLSQVSRELEELVDSTLAFHADLLRRTADRMGDALDAAARRDVEGSEDWRATNRREGRFNASTCP